MKSKRPAVTWDKDQGAYLVPGEPATVDGLIEALDRQRKARGLSLYRIAQLSRMGVPAVSRFFQGYKGTTQGNRGEVSNPDSPGRVRFETALAIIQAIGLDVELVARQPAKE